MNRKEPDWRRNLEGEKPRSMHSRIVYLTTYSSVKFVKCNVTIWADQLAVFKTAISSSSSGKIDIVIANAGISGGDSVFFNNGIA